MELTRAIEKMRMVFSAGRKKGLKEGLQEAHQDMMIPCREAEAYIGIGLDYILAIQDALINKKEQPSRPPELDNPPPDIDAIFDSFFKEHFERNEEVGDEIDESD